MLNTQTPPTSVNESKPSIIQRVLTFFKGLIMSIVGALAVVLVFMVGMFVATRGDYSVPDTVATNPNLPHVTLDGYRFHAQTFGNSKNPVVIVVHGGPGADYGYLLNLHQLEDEYFVVFYDQRGAGLSPRVDASEITLASSVADLHNFVTHYGGGDTVHLIGHSWGGMLVAAYLGQHPEWVSKAVLAEPGELTSRTPEQLQARRAESRDWAYFRMLIPTIFQSVHIDAQDDHARDDYIYGRMTQAFVDSDASSYTCQDPAVSTVIPDAHVPPSRFGTIAFQALFGVGADLSAIAANAGNYSNEVLFLASECNTFLGEAFQRQQMTVFPNASLEVISNAGHNMISENPTESLAVIRAYFEGL